MTKLFSIVSNLQTHYHFKLDFHKMDQYLYNASHWGRVTHICVSKLAIIGSDNGLSPDRRHAIIWTNDGLLLIGPSGTNFSEILIEILTFSFKKIRLKVSSAKRRPFCLGLNVLRNYMFALITIRSGGRLNKKDGLTRYGNSHVKDKTS